MRVVLPLLILPVGFRPASVHASLWSRLNPELRTIEAEHQSISLESAKLPEIPTPQTLEETVFGGNSVKLCEQLEVGL